MGTIARLNTAKKKLAQAEQAMPGAYQNNYTDSINQKLVQLADASLTGSTGVDTDALNAAYQQYRPIAQKLKSAKFPAAFEEQHRAELTAYRKAVAYFKANNITKLPSPNKLEAEYCALASEKAQFYEQYKEAKSELLKLKDAKQNVALFFREDERTQHHER